MTSKYFYLPHELAERMNMALIGFFNENPQLINTNTIQEVNDYENGLITYIPNMFRYFDEENGDVNFGEYALSNGYLSNTDIEEITNYIYNNNLETDRYYPYDIVNYSDLVNMNDKINYFMGDYRFRINLVDIMNDIYTNRNNDVYLK